MAAETLPAVDVDDFRVWWEQGLARKATETRSKSWKLIALAATFAGVALVGSVYILNGGTPSLPKESPGAPVSKATAQPPGGETVAASTDAGRHFSKDGAQSTQVNVVKQQPVDLSTQASLGSAPPPAGASAAVGVIPPPAEHSEATKVDALPVTAQHAPPPAQSPDPNPARTISLRPGGTPTATFTAASTESWSSADVPIPPPRPALDAANDAVGTAQSSMPRLVLLTKRPYKSPAPVVFAKSEAITSAEAGMRSLSIPPGTPAKSEKPAGGPETPQAAAEPVAAPVTPAEGAKQSFDRMLHTLGDLLGPKAPPTQQRVDQTDAASTGWAVQMAAPKSEADAKSDLRRLNAKYASALHGSKIGVHTAILDGETVYRLRVVDLSRADASALCARLKNDGGSCFVAK